MVSRHSEKIHWILPAALLHLTVFIPLIEAANYDGYKVYRLYPDTSEKIALLKSLDGIAGYDFWQEPRANASKLMVAPEQQKEFEELMDSEEISTAITTQDLGAKMQENAKTQRDYQELTGGGRRSNSPRGWNNFAFDRFLRYNEIYEFAETLAKSNRAAKFFIFGRSSEGRKMFGVKLSTSPKNPVIVIDGGIHAREWSAPISVLYILQKLIKNDSVLDSVTFYIVPLVNPDGYEFTHTDDRLWRKTKSRQAFSDCMGVDANRNFDSHWNEFGAESDPCSHIYSGPKAFSEPESRALRNVIQIARPVMYLTFHSFGGLILHPWGFTSDPPPNGQELDSLGRKAAAKIAELFGLNYTVGSSTNLLYPASGGSDDWAMEKGGVPLSFCVELEDFGSEFELPPSKINEVVQHANTIVQIFAQHVHANYRSDSAPDDSTNLWD